MPYSTIDDLKNYLPASQILQLTDDADIDTIDNDKLNDAIRRSDNLVDGYLRGRFDLPLATVPELIRDLSTKLSSYFLFKRSLILSMPESITEDYKYCTDILVKIQKGMITVFTDATEEPAFFGTNKTDASNVTSSQTSEWTAY
jgi:phage gp36-like protein